MPASARWPKLQSLGAEGRALGSLGSRAVRVLDLLHRRLLSPGPEVRDRHQSGILQDSCLHGLNSI